MKQNLLLLNYKKTKLLMQNTVTMICTEITTATVNVISALTFLVFRRILRVSAGSPEVAPQGGAMSHGGGEGRT